MGGSHNYGPLFGNPYDQDHRLLLCILGTPTYYSLERGCRTIYLGSPSFFGVGFGRAAMLHLSEASIYRP